ncbi:cell division protein FtsL [Carnobacterium funditum]|uniref:cell division protein FtsL n=1 Tax=Carnobacterium funditum TaxID=2752 RepID=UPI000558377A|nr:cell division protein FtsL [Carnobacterium funditum]
MSLNSNLARNVEVEMPLQSPLATPKQTNSPIHKPIPGKSIVTRTEKMLIGMIMTIAFTLIAVSISLEINVASINRALQDTKTSIVSTTTINNNLKQEVQELSRYDRIYKIANNQGLKMNEANVRNVIK